MRTHKDHPATCFCCDHLILCSPGPAYPDDNDPGAPLGFVCTKDGFVDFEDGDPRNLHNIVGLAQTCDSYDPKED